MLNRAVINHAEKKYLGSSSLVVGRIVAILSIFYVRVNASKGSKSQCGKFSWRSITMHSPSVSTPVHLQQSQRIDSNMKARKLNNLSEQRANSVELVPIP